MSFYEMIESALVYGTKDAILTYPSSFRSDTKFLYSETSQILSSDGAYTSDLVKRDEQSKLSPAEQKTLNQWANDINGKLKLLGSELAEAHALLFVSQKRSATLQQAGMQNAVNIELERQAIIKGQIRRYKDAISYATVWRWVNYDMLGFRESILKPYKGTKLYDPIKSELEVNPLLVVWRSFRERLDLASSGASREFPITENDLVRQTFPRVFQIRLRKAFGDLPKA